MASWLDKINPFNKPVKLAEQKDSRPVVHVKEEGNTGTEITSGVLNEDYLSEFVGTEAADIYDKMRRSDPRVKMCLMAVMSPIKGASWQIEAAGDEKDQILHKELVEHCIFQSKYKRWKQFLHEILTMIPFGYSLFERSHVAIKGHPKFGDIIAYRNFGWRSPRTIEYWRVDDNESLIAVDQFSDGDFQENNTMDARFLSLFTLDREGSNFEGVSMLRPAYGSWLRKRVYQKLQAIGIEKYAVPTPVLTVPEDKGTSAQFTEMKTILQAYTSHQSQYITKPEGWELEINANNFDATQVQSAIDAENMEMVNAFLANFLLLGQQGSGSYALSTDLSDFFLSAIEHVAEIICEVFNDQIIPELIKLNYGPQEEYPKMICTGISDRAGKEFAEVLQILGSAKAIIPDDKLEEYVRDKYGLPEASEDGQRKQEPPKPPGMPGASPVPPGSPGGSGPDQGDSSGAGKSDTGDGRSTNGGSSDMRNDSAATEDESENVTLVEQEGAIVFAEPPRRQITDDTKAMRKLMEANTKKMGEALVGRIMRRLSNTSEAQRMTAIKDQKIMGTAAYKAELLDELANISDKALRRARSEVPKKQRVELAEFERLPKDVQKRLKAEADLIVQTQAKDLEKAVFFQFRSSMDQEDSFVESDLNGTVEDYSTSPSVVAAAGNTTARVINESRNAFFFDDEVLEDIQAFKFNNPDPISPICKNLSGRIFDKDDPESAAYMPPLHHNCKSYITPILRGARKPDISAVGLRPVGTEKEVEQALKSITLKEGKNDPK